MLNRRMEKIPEIFLSSSSDTEDNMSKYVTTPSFHLPSNSVLTVVLISDDQKLITNCEALYYAHVHIGIISLIFQLNIFQSIS